MKKRIRLSLAKKALLSVAVILLPVLVTFVYTYHENKLLLSAQVLADLTVVADAYEGKVYQFLEMSKRRAEDFSSDGFIKDELKRITAGEGSSAALNMHLVRNKLSLDRQIRAIQVIDLKGRVAASTDASLIGRDVSMEPFFAMGRYGTTAMDGPFGAGGAIELSVSTPVRERTTGTVLGVIATFISLSELDRVLSGEYMRELGAVTWAKGRRDTLGAYMVNGKSIMITEPRFAKA